MEELIHTKLDEIIKLACQESSKIYTWRGKLNATDDFDWKIMVNCLNENEECLIKIKKRIVN